MSDKQDELQPIIIKKVKKGGGGHHGGAWKVAYADFVTAMMAFFLLLWLLNVSTDDAKSAIANVFDPTDDRVSESLSGAGGVLGGLTIAPKGAMTSEMSPLMPTPSPSTLKMGARPLPDTPPDPNTQIDADPANAVDPAEAQFRAAEEEKFQELKDQIEAAIKNSPEFDDLKKNIIVDITSEGLRIQILDSQGKPMFARGSAEILNWAEDLMTRVAGIIKDTSNNISVRGHTDGRPYGPGATYTNWELSSDRANASRRVLLTSNLKEERIANVVGKADTEHLFPDNPLDDRNRRISIILLREKYDPAKAGNGSERKRSRAPAKEEEPKLYQRSPARIEFP